MLEGVGIYMANGRMKWNLLCVNDNRSFIYPLINSIQIARYYYFPRYFYKPHETKVLIITGNTEHIIMIAGIDKYEVDYLLTSRIAGSASEGEDDEISIIASSITHVSESFPTTF